MSRTVGGKRDSFVIHAQKGTHDCGVAALATLIGSTYERAFVAAVATSPDFESSGLSIDEVITMAKGFGRKLVRVNHRRVNLREHTGLLVVNWHRSQWKRHGARGHWVVLSEGTIIDPSGPAHGKARDYLVINKGRAGTLLQEQ